MGAVLEYLTAREWSMGNGQCPECAGVPASWHGHPLYLVAADIGHRAGCPLAAAIRDSGGDALMQGAFVSADVYESYIDENGFYGTRLKTEGGCPKLRAEAEALRDDILDRIVTGLAADSAA